MRFADPYTLRLKTPRDMLVFAARSDTGGKPEQLDYALNFNDESFALGDGSEEYPNGNIAAKLACETAIWGYKHIRMRPYYWQDKKKFMKRIFRSTNLAVWQKRREEGFSGGLATALTVCIVGPKMYWLGIKGDMSAWLAGGGAIEKISPEFQPFSRDAAILGTQRLGIVPYYRTGPLETGSSLILTTSGCGNYLTPQDLDKAVGLAGETNEGAALAAESLLRSASINGSRENMSAWVIKRVAVG